MQAPAGKVAVVTGAGSGIGRALAHQLAAEGCHLALADLDRENLAEVARELDRHDLKITTHLLDVAERAAVYAFADEVLAAHGSVQLVINNAGVALRRPSRNCVTTTSNGSWASTSGAWCMAPRPSCPTC